MNDYELQQVVTQLTRIANALEKLAGDYLSSQTKITFQPTFCIHEWYDTTSGRICKKCGMKLPVQYQPSVTPTV